jgi:hypothetical protein
MVTKWQKKVGLNVKSFSNFLNYTRETWWSLNRDCLEYVVDYTKNKRIT